MITTFLLFLLCPAAAEDPNTVTSFQTLSATTLAKSKELSALSISIHAAVFIVILAITLFPTEKYYKTQVIILELAGLTIGVYEIIFATFLPFLATPLLVIPIAIVGGVLLYVKATKPLAVPLAGVYPVSMMVICMLNMQTWFMAQVIEILIGGGLILLYSVAPGMFLYIFKPFTYTLLTCCILELVLFKIISSSLTSDAITVLPSMWISRFLIAVMIIIYGFITPILNRLLAPNESSKTTEEENEEEKV